MKNIRNSFFCGLCFTIIFFSAGCKKIEDKKPFSLNTLQPVWVKKNGAEIFQLWEFGNALYLWDTNFVEPQAIKSYKDSVCTLLGRDSFLDIVKALSLQDKSYVSVHTQNGDSINAQLVHANVAGRIRPINYLEAQLLSYQLNRYPLLSHPTEFHGFVLVHDALQKVRVYFAASDAPWPPKPGMIIDAVQYDLKKGWTFKTHLHNHYEPKTNNYLGILAPSMTDAQFYHWLSEEYRLQQAVITNGLHAVEIDRSDFYKLKLPPE